LRTFKRLWLRLKQKRRIKQMTTTTYKGYTVRTVGLSQYIYRPGTFTPGTKLYPPGYAQSMAAAKRWINEDLTANGYG
jgi:hypothetical protein